MSGIGARVAGIRRFLYSRLKAVMRRTRRIIFGIGPPYHELRNSIVELHIRLDAVTARHNATIAFYEQRIDLIYRRVVDTMSGMLEGDHIVAESVSGVEKRLGELFAGGLLAPVDPKSLKLSELLSGEMRRGVIEPPLTLFGFRLNRDRAIETGDAVRIYAGAKGLAVYGPNLRIVPGHYQLVWRVSAPTSTAVGGHGQCVLEVFSPAVDRIIASASASVDTDLEKVAVAFDWSAENAAGEIEFRLHQKSDAELLATSLALS